MPSRRRSLPAGLVLLLVLGAGSVAAQADIHVAPGGDDTHPGTRRRPLASFEAARDAVRRLRAEGRIPRGGLTVQVHPGDYPRHATLEFSAADSGTAESPVRWVAAGTGRVRLLGGRRVEEFRAVDDPAVLDRLDPRARGQVRVADLDSWAVSAWGTLTSRGFGRPTTPAHSELFHGGRPMTLARWPDEGAFEVIAGFPEGSGKGDEHGGSLGQLSGGFLHASDRPRRWRDTSDLWVHGYWAWDWANSYERVAALDVAGRRILTAPPHGLYGFRKGQRFYFLNVLEELDQPGEWFLDRAGSRLYFWPPTPADGVEARSSETLVSLLEGPLIRFENTSHLRIEGWVLEATRGSAIEMARGSDITVAGCVIRNVGNVGVVVRGGKRHRVQSCDILDTGDGGVSLDGGDRATLEPGEHVVDNCRFQRQGRWSKCYVPAVLLSGVGHQVSHNWISDHPHCAILYTGNDHRIEFNEIDHIALETGDVGAIYTGRNYTYRGNRIRHNFIHDTGGVGMGSMGAYMDDCVSGTEIFGNLFVRVQRAAFIGGGRDHRVENNVFVDCLPAVQIDGRGLDRSPVWRGMVKDTMRKGLTEVPLALYRERYPEMTSLDAHYGPPGGPVLDGDAFLGVPPGNNRVARNVCVGKWLDLGWHARTNGVRVEGNLVGADPAFVGRRAGQGRMTAEEFALRPESPAWGLGFQPLPLGEMGLQPDAWRRRMSKERAR